MHPESGGQAGTRTQDQMVKSRLLYQLSYLSIRHRSPELSAARDGSYTRIFALQVVSSISSVQMNDATVSGKETIYGVR